jgi:hypothetical protein
MYKPDKDRELHDPVLMKCKNLQLKEVVNSDEADYYQYARNGE